ncbi:hypothetical protein POSPLADRAFT_1035065 [Postia placenta MAD-698-R-SB12]|uniref:Uncharacterized protein n=1 Tax=Postia placenta MAD-698-R-SB12 TaxID=670580 RepID=A0A1X6MVV6_9APHY|nr:hypothetical protein POSPLADRAFT_1035065 [Postia placenta MAD-698-R-SB12]OSX60515.1 hypothetical protein POSPLADRAFT_1035065 [Postia placenta MAD-698-R-SB12]
MYYFTSLCGITKLTLLQAGWTNFGNAANILAVVQFVKDALKEIYDRISTAEKKLAEVKKALDGCESLLEQMLVKDPLLGKIIEKRHRHFISLFEKQVRIARAEHDKYLERIIAKESDVSYGELLKSIEALKNTVNDLYCDKLRTSNAVRTEEPIYQEMYDKWYHRPPIYPEYILDLELDAVYKRHQSRSNDFCVYIGEIEFIRIHNC